MNAITLLRRLTHNAAAEWRTPHQWIAIQHILAWKTDLLIVMPTGSGKTVVTLIPTIMDGDVTVYILPLNSLIMDYKRRLDGMKIAYDHFTGANPQLRQDVSIILVSVDRAVTNHWKHCITNLNDKRAVTRLVIDEAHIALTAHEYRDVFKMLAYLRCLGFQIILLSGSVPPVATQHIQDLFRLHPINTIVLRMPTDRPELEYVRLPKINNNDDMINKVKSIINRTYIYTFPNRLVIRGNGVTSNQAKIRPSIISLL
jgi:superfamily II DNA helicase RecQ